MPGAGAHALDRGVDPAGGDQMVVLDQHRIVEAEAMIEPAAATHGIFLQAAQPRQCLARADDARRRSGHGIDKRACRGGNTRQMAGEIERDPLGRQQGARQAFDGRERRAGLDRAAVEFLGAKCGFGIDQAEGAFGRDQPGNGARLARHDPRARALLGWDRQIGGDVAGTAEIFFECGPHDRFHQKRMGRARKGQGEASLRHGRVARSWSGPRRRCVSLGEGKEGTCAGFVRSRIVGAEMGTAAFVPVQGRGGDKFGGGRHVEQGRLGRRRRVRPLR